MMHLRRDARIGYYHHNSSDPIEKAKLVISGRPDCDMFFCDVTVSGDISDVLRAGVVATEIHRLAHQYSEDLHCDDVIICVTADGATPSRNLMLMLEAITGGSHAD